MATNDDTDDSLIEDGTRVERHNKFNFLGSFITTEGDSRKEIDRRLGMGKSMVGSQQTIWRDKEIRRTSKVGLMRSLAFSIVIYSSEW